MTLDYDLVMPSGKSPGVALLGWSQRQTQGLIQISLCPMEVLTAMEGDRLRLIDDQYLCKDVQGKPLRLALGTVATVQMRDTDGSVFVSEDGYMLQEPGIAKAIGFDKVNHGPIVQAVTKGSTSVAMLAHKDKKVVARICEVLVE